MRRFGLLTRPSGAVLRDVIGWQRGLHIIGCCLIFVRILNKLLSVPKSDFCFICVASWFPTLISCSPNLPRVYIRLCKHGNHFTFLQSRLAFQVLRDFLRGILVMHWSALPVLGECLLQRKRYFAEISHRVNLSLYPFETRAVR